jgi:uroporphyrinogen-III synthase
VNLIAYVRRHADPRAGRFLYLSDFDINLDLGTGLAPAEFAVDRVVVYRAVAVECMGVGGMREIAQGGFNAAVFLSARTAAVFCSLAIVAGLVEACARMTAITISRKVAEALRSAGFAGW